MATTGSERTRAVLKIADGCDNFCAYCIIPYARGPVRSKKISACVSEFKALLEMGYKEIVLTGIEISLYGKDIGSSLIELLSELGTVATQYPSARLRLGSLEPRVITEDFVELVKKLDFICPHFHLSLQSGSDSVLKRMGRKYNTHDFLAVCNLLYDNIENVSITTDIIVGFPEESDEEFQETAEFVKACRFLKIHIFPYSIRSGTRAATMTQVEPSVKSARVKELTKICEEVSREFLQTLDGKELLVLFETSRENEYKGHSSNYIEMKLKSDVDIIGQIVKMKYSFDS